MERRMESGVCCGLRACSRKGVARRRMDFGDGRRVCVCAIWLFYYCARSGLCVRKHTEERRNAEEEEEGARCVLCVRRGVQEKMCVCECC